MGGVASAVGNVAGLAGGGASMIGNVFGEISGSNAAARAAQNAANAQADSARSERATILGEARNLEGKVMDLANASPEELNALGRSYTSATQALDREQQMIAAIDPSILEASKQALSILRGGTAELNKPMTDMRNMQRQQLVNSLRSQYGPGAESSSIGQKHLQQFDMETNSMFQNNQQNSLAQLFGIANTDLGQRAQRGIAGLEQVGQGYGNLNQRKLSAMENVGGNTLAALGGTSAAIQQAAGAPYVGDALRAQAQQGLFNQAVQVGGGALGSYMGGKGFAAGMKQRPDNTSPVD